jgi:hypothetical protein
LLMIPFLVNAMLMRSHRGTSCRRGFHGGSCCF